MATRSASSVAGVPFVSIVVSVLNPSEILDLISSILRLRYPPNRVEIIFVIEKNKSNYLVMYRKKLERFKRIRFVNPIGQPSQSRFYEAGLRITKGEYILFTESYYFPQPRWVEKMLEPFKQDSQIGLVGGEIFSRSVNQPKKAELYCEQIGFLSVSNRMGKKVEGVYPAIGNNRRPSNVNGSSNCPYFDMANVALSRKAARAVRKRFEDYSSVVSVDFSIRVSQAGYRLYFKPEAFVERFRSMNLKEFYFELNKMGFGRVLAIKLYAKRVLELRFQFLGEHSVMIPFPLPTLIYWGDFHFLHLFGILTILKTIVLVFGRNPLGVVLGSDNILLGWCLFSFFLFKYFLPVLKIQPGSDFFLWCWIRYRSNMSIFLGALKGGFKFKRLYWAESW